jgi:hypothetical protein
VVFFARERAGGRPRNTSRTSRILRAADHAIAKLSAKNTSLLAVGGGHHDVRDATALGGAHVARAYIFRFEGGGTGG